MFSIEEFIRASSADRGSTSSITQLRCGATFASVKPVPYTTPLPGVVASAPSGREPNAAVDVSSARAIASAFRYPPVTSIRGYAAPDHEEDRRWPLDELAITYVPTSDRSPSGNVASASEGVSSASKATTASHPTAGTSKAVAPTSRAIAATSKADSESTAASKRKRSSRRSKR